MPALVFTFYLVVIMPDTSIVLYMSHVFTPYNDPTSSALLWLFNDRKPRNRVVELPKAIQTVSGRTPELAESRDSAFCTIPHCLP